MIPREPSAERADYRAKSGNTKRVQENYERNWTLYNLARQHEKEYMEVLTQDVCGNLPPQLPRESVRASSCLVARCRFCDAPKELFKTGWSHI
jgi:hypothetical protein